jgi:hypothetical protein
MGTDQNMPMDPALLQKFPGLVKLPARAGSQDWSFPYDDTWGEGVIVSKLYMSARTRIVDIIGKVYVVDGGVKFDHEDLFGRVEEGHVIDRITDGKPVRDGVKSSTSLLTTHTSGDGRCMQSWSTYPNLPTMTLNSSTLT